MESIANEVTIAVIGAVVVAFLFYIFNTLFKGINLDGEWIATIKVRESSYKPYLKLSAKFRFHLLRVDKTVTGTGEKISNSNHDAPDTVYERANRIIVQIEGTYTKNYFKKDQLILKIIENGRQRQSRATYHLKEVSKNEFNGDFESTAADSVGEVKLKRAKTYFK